MSTRPVIETIVVQPTPFCNIDCSYCYLPNRNDRVDDVARHRCGAVREVFASGWAGDLDDRDLACRRTAGAAVPLLSRRLRR